MVCSGSETKRPPELNASRPTAPSQSPTPPLGLPGPGALPGSDAKVETQEALAILAAWTMQIGRMCALLLVIGTLHRSSSLLFWCLLKTCVSRDGNTKPSWTQWQLAKRIERLKPEPPPLSLQPRPFG